MSENVEFCDSSGSDIMEEEFDDESEQRVNVVLSGENNIRKEDGKRVPEKRFRQDDEEIIEDDGFITIRREYKRVDRGNSELEEEKNTGHSNCSEKFIVCVTSTEILPKQFGMAKLLRQENIQDISKIQYKGPYKALIHFDKKDSTQKLINSKKLSDLGYRTRMIDENTVSYGILKQVDLDTDEKEILENLKCDYDIVSIKRLKRLAHTGEWINSETIRLCFKSSTLPTHVYGFGCRFKVEPYTFPVTQCSGCWKFGHLSRSCPSKKILCPKCGGNHNNCETTTYKCINCQGPHMSMYKNCPIFLKEKEIRKIMSERNCAYRKGLEIYLASREMQKNTDILCEDRIEQLGTVYQNEPQKKTYSEIVIQKALIHRENIISPVIENEQQSQSSRKEVNIEPQKNKRGNNNKAKRRNNAENYKSQESLIHTGEEAMEQEVDENDTAKNFDFKRIISKIKDICFSSSSINVKLELICNFIVQEVVWLFISIFKSKDTCKSFISIFNNGG